MASRQPLRNFDEALVGQQLDALITAKGRLLSLRAKLTAELTEDQFRMRLADDSLTLRRNEIVDFPDLVSDIPELAGDAHAWSFMPPIILVGGSLIRKFPEIRASAEEDGGADQRAGADVAVSVARHLQPDRHVDHRPPIRHREQPAEIRRIIEAMVAPIIDPGRDPPATKSIEPEILGHAPLPFAADGP